jgi:IPT/TIG domain
MQVTITGSQLPFPSWDMSSNFFSGQTPYISTRITSNASGQSWTAGLPVTSPGNQSLSPVEFEFLQANSSQISIRGFDGQYGTTSPAGVAQIASPGSNVEVFVSDPVSGATASISQKVPVPAIIFGLGNNVGQLFVNQTAQLSGELQDSNHCQEGDATISISASPLGSFSSSGQNPITVSTNEEGGFSTTFNAPSTAGNVTVTVPSLGASLSIPVLPVLTSISPNIGPVGGGQAVTINGNGFVNPVSASFSGETVTPGSASAITTSAVPLTTPPSPFGGDGYGIVNVSVTVNGVAGTKTLPYTYVPAFAPVVRSSQTGPCAAAMLTVAMYDQNGNAIAASNPDYQIVLGGPTNSIAGTNGQVDTITLPSESQVQVYSEGPFTAQGRHMSGGTWTTVGTTNPSPTFKFFFESPGSIICGGFQAIWIPNLQFPLGVIPPEILTVNGQCKPDCGGNVPILWGGRGLSDPFYVTAFGKASLSQQIAVTVLSDADSQAIVSAAPLVAYERAASGRFRSPIVQIGSNGELTGDLPMPLQFAVRRSTDRLSLGGHLELFHLSQSGNVHVWSKEGIAKQQLAGDYLRATVRQAGSYEVIEIQDTY